MPMHVADVGEALLARARGTRQTVLLESGPWEQALLRVDTGDHWRMNAEPGGLQLLVLEGMATLACTSLRETLGPGHLAIFDGGEEVEVINDGDQPFLALLTQHLDSELEDL